MLNNKEYVVHHVKCNPVHSILRLIPIVVLAFLFFGGFVIDRSLQKGMNNMASRLGADLMLVPEGTKEDAKNLLLEGARGSFYFHKSVYEGVESAEGIKNATAQLFLKSLTADCCSAEVEIVFFDPETDFLIEPWIQKEYKEQLKNDMVVIGNAIDETDSKRIKLFGREYRIAARMAKTGTSLDNSVYFTFDSFDTVIADAENKGSFLNQNQKSTDVISSVFIKLEDGVQTKEVLKEVHVLVKEKFEVVYPKQLASSLSLNLAGIYTSIHVILITGAGLLLFILFIANVMDAREKKREIALIRMMGVSKRKLIQTVSEEVMFLCIAGAIMGCMLGTLFVIPFGNYIGVRLEMPYLGPSFLHVLFLYGVITVMVVLIGLMASIYPVLYITKMDPYEALRKEGE